MDAKQKQEFNKLTNWYKNIKGKLDKANLKEAERYRILSKHQETRKRINEEKATKQLCFRDNEHEFFKLKQINYKFSNFYNSKRGTLQDLDINKDVDFNINNGKKKDMWKTFYSVHQPGVELESPKVKRALNFDSYNCGSMIAEKDCSNEKNIVEIFVTVRNWPIGF